MPSCAKLGTGVLAGLIAGTVACADDSPVSTIELTRLDGALRIEGFVSGGTGEATARLEIQHSGSGGNMTTRQARTLMLQQGARFSVASTQINFDTTSTLAVDLVVEAADGIVAHSQTRITREAD
ncbi:curli-like amyloid fiber formation chaperone CsgH [Szabonella alba]|uniref:Curli assembly protein CsgC n=1 Tax=Szabonella alba TaxID=2804194 RepID=A0A8K0VEQ6_9RHOB|nr:curli-like amyloid fiber formation chaperone CsgH [Szabonella alba]MBL4918883.1 hypothetical protein [Szabonella alba]